MIKWVSVKERLPLEGSVVVAWLSRKKEPACVRFEIDKLGPKWTELVQVEIWNDREDLISHWLPLPEPPVAEQLVDS